MLMQSYERPNEMNDSLNPKVMDPLSDALEPRPYFSKVLKRSLPRQSLSRPTPPGADPQATPPVLLVLLTRETR